MKLLHDECIAEAVCCALCKNPMHTDTGCDGACNVDKNLLTRIMKAINDACEELTDEGIN